jgi:hypothetical protein
MTQLARGTPLVVVLLLLASVGTASAECAWVLWGRATVEYPPGVMFNTGDVRRQLWSPLAAYESRKECEVAAKDTRSVLASLLEEYPLRPGARVDVQTGKRSPDDRLPTPTLHVRCLPDTVDPRGPKSN